MERHGGRGIHAVVVKALAIVVAVSSCGKDGMRPPARTPVASVAVSGAKNAIEVGETLQLSAVTRDAKGTVIGGRTIEFLSSDATIASVTTAGLVSGAAAGTATITARSEGQSAPFGLTVSRAAVFLIGVTPTPLVVKVGTTTPLTALMRDARGVTLTDRVPTWTTSDATVATVDGSGRVNAIAPGHAAISATADGRIGVADFTVVSGQNQNLTLDGVYLTQAVQRFEGTVPLVAGGLPMLANVFGTMREPPVTGSPPIMIRIRVLKNGAVVTEDTRALTGTIGTTINRDQPNHQVIFPGSIVQSGMSVVAEIDPAATVTETARDDNVFPRGGAPPALDVRTVPPLALRFVPIFLSNGGSTGNVNAGNIAEYLETLREVHPLSEVTTSIGAALSTDVSFGGGEITAWSQILQQLDTRRVMEGTNLYYYGALRPPPGINFVTFGGIGYIGTSATNTGPATRTAAGVGIGWFNDALKSTQLVAHELGHNMGRQHAPCGGAGSPDPRYPYPGGLIGAYGHDLYTYSRIGGSVAAKAPATATDVMGYCSNVWISDYTYEAILNFRAPIAMAAIADAGAPTETVVISGVVDHDALALNPVFVAHTRPALPDRPGPYVLEGIAADKRVLFRLAFAPQAIDHAAPGFEHFSFAVPLAAADRAALSRVRVSRNAVSAEMRDASLDARAAGASGSATPEVTLARLASGRVDLRWNAAVWPAVLVRDPTTGEIIGMGRSGHLVVLSSRPTLDVTLSSGLRSETRTMTVRTR